MYVLCHDTKDGWEVPPAIASVLYASVKDIGSFGHFGLALNESFNRIIQNKNKQ